MKRLIVAAGVAAALIGAGYGYYWHYVAGRLETGIEDWAARQRGLGHEIAFVRDPISGFPFALRTSFRAVSLTWQQPGGTLSVAGDVLLAEMRPWNLQKIFVAGERVVTLTLADHAGSQQRAILQRGDAGIVLRADGQLRSATLSMHDVAFESNAGTYAAIHVDAAIELPADLPLDYRQKLIAFEATLTSLRLPAGQRAVTQEPIEKLTVTGSVMGPVPAAADLRAALASWARAGGTIELRNFDFVQAPLTVAGVGTVTLDEALQPLGALTIRAQGLPETIALLEQDGMIDAQAAKTGSMMAKGLAKPDAEGRDVVSVSLGLQQGYLWLGPVKLARLPELDW